VSSSLWLPLWSPATARALSPLFHTDELTGGKLHPNFIYKGSSEDRTRPQITLRLANVPVSEVIRYVGELTGTSFAFEPHAVVGTPVAMLSKEPAVPAAK
jgi:hypothetical protein